MANPLPEEKELYERIRKEGISITEDIWDFMYHRVNDNTTAIILICQHWLQMQEPMPVQEAERILAWTKDIKNTISAITAHSNKSPFFPQYQNAASLNPVVQELITHQFGNDIYAIDLMVQDAIDPLGPAPICADVMQRIIVHAQAVMEFLEKFRDTVQWKSSKEKYYHLYDSFRDGLVMTDLEGHILDANQAYANMLDYTKEELTALTYQQLTPEKWHKIQEDLVKTLLTKADNSIEYQKEYIKKGGTVFPVGIKAWLIRDAQGNPRGIWGVVRDITERKKVQKEFEEEIFATHAIIDNIGTGLSLSDKKGRFVIFNHRMQEITGYTMEEINTQDLGALLYPDLEEWEKAIGRLSEITTGSETSDVESRIRVKDGVEKIVSVSTSLIKYKGNEMFLSVWRDITERKLAEAALRRERDRAEKYLNTVETIIVALDTEGKITAINRKGCQLFGYKEEELVGQSWFAKCLPYPDGMNKMHQFFLKLIAGELENSEYFENPIVTRSGQLRWIEWHNALLRDGQGKVAGTLSSGNDITERRRLEGAVQESETRFRRLFETAQDGILILNASTGYITEVNPFLVKMLGYSRDEFLGKELWQVGAFADIDKSKTAFKTLTSQGYVRYEDLPLQAKDGHLINVEFVSNVYSVDRASVIQCNIRDITDRRKLELEQEKLNKELEQLTLRDSHTGLYNYRYLREALVTSFSRAQRQGAPLSVIMIDIDYFKSINDVYGHVFGDLVLKQFAAQLTKAIRPYDVAVRYGGEEFIVLSSDTDRAGAVTLGKRILEKVTLHSFGNASHSIKLKLSLGIAAYPEDPIQKSEELVNYADRILDKAKENGGNRVYSSLDIENEADLAQKVPGIALLKEKIAKLTKRASQSLIEETFAFAKTIELKDHYTGRHVAKTVGYAVKIARALHFADDKIELIKEAAMLHDLGKIGISEHILHKKSKLNSAELAEIRKHPQIGVDIIRPIHSLHPIIPLLLYHHERWDGKGYPHGVSGQMIPLGARVIAIADVYQALRSNRPYRKAFSKQKALEIIKKSSGTHFDPEVVKAFLAVLRQECASPSGADPVIPAYN